ncbi:MAG: hypothetical protein H8E29_01665 [Anaerolineales bacterium]|uniref:Uncharacterized protein n=1 Tax=Candidatus Desulfolinea nitratireducens TaxID=2841698 RepID=A0A8J6NJB6_9CHLR|nr:hypothetical protein [Candidatus Desulfolinea nitratireducens]
MESIEIIIYNFRLWVNPTGSWPKDNALKGPVKLDERCFARNRPRSPAPAGLPPLALTFTSGRGMESIEIIIYNFRLWVNPTGSWPKDDKSPSLASPSGASAISPDVHVRARNGEHRNYYLQFPPVGEPNRLMAKGR